MPDQESSSGTGAWPAVPGRTGAITGIPWRAQLVSAGFILTDFAGVALAYLLSAYIYTMPFLEGWRLRAQCDPADLQLMGMGIGLLTIMVFSGLGLYRRGVSVLNVEEDLQLLRGFFLCAVAALALSFILRDRELPRIAIGLAVLISMPLVILGRRMIRGLSSWLLSAGVGAQPAVIYGAGDTGRQLADRLLRNPQYGLLPVGFIDDAHSPEDGKICFGPGRKRCLEFLGGADRLVYTMKSRGVRMLLVAIPRMSSADLAAIQEKCRDSQMQCYHVPLFSAGPLRRFSITFIGDMPLICERAPSSTLLGRFSKRAFDVVVSGMLLVLLSIVFLSVAVAIKLTSPGPVFFVQQRAGRFGLNFGMIKFRSMHVSAPAYANKPASGGDPRIFPVGRILRRTSLDELPQLWNVFRGEMSLVGPRPEMPQVVEQYNTVQRERFAVLPGMTGLWQVSADRNLPIHENVDYDLYYIYNQSLLLDLVILARTGFAMFSGH